MIAATLKVLTWGTVATAVLSAVWLAVDGDGLLRTERDSGVATLHSETPAPQAAPERSSRSTGPARSEADADRRR